MNEPKNDHPRFKNPQGDAVHGRHGPYWKSAHRDWRIWFVVILMLIAMVVYVRTGDLRWPLHAQPQPMVPIAS